MPSAPRNAPPRPTYEEARETIERLEPLMKQVQQEMEALEGSDGRLTKLMTDIGLLEADLRDEEALAADERNGLLIEQIKGELIGLRAALPLVQKELWRLMDVYNEYLEKSDEAGEVLLEGMGGKKDRPPKYIAEALAGYEKVFESWSSDFEKLRQEQHIDGIVTVETRWLPVRKAVGNFVAEHDARKARGGELDLTACEKLQAQLAEDKMREILAALADLPAALNPGPRQQVVEQATTAFREAFAALKEAEAAGARPTRKLQLLREVEAAIPGLRMVAGDSLASTDFAPFKQAYQDKARALNAVHLPAVQAAEQDLSQVIGSDPAAREALILARMGEAVPVADARREALERPDGQSGYYVKFLEQLGVPLDLASVQRALNARTADAKAHAGTVVAGALPFTDRMVVDAWKQDLSVLLGQNEDPDQQRFSGERLARLHIQEPNERLLQVLGMAAEPLDGEEGARAVKKLLDQYLDDLLDGDKLVTDESKVIEGLSKGLLDLLMTKVPRVFSGEVQAEQKAAVLDPAKRALPAKEYLAALMTAEAVPPAAAPDRAADRARAVAWVSKFMASMEQVERLKSEPERVAVQDRAKKMNEAGQDYEGIVRERVEAGERAKQLREDRGDITDIKAKVEEIERTRGQNSLGRKRFAEGLKRKKEDLLDDARKAMEKANRDFEKADKEVGSYGESYHYKQAKQRFATADSLVKALEAGDVAVLSANHTRDPQSLEWLRLINGVVLGGRTCNGQEIVEKAVHGREEAILVHFPTDRYYVPPALMGKSLTELDERPFIVQAFFQEARQQVNEVVKVLNWFESNTKRALSLQTRYEWRDRAGLMRQAERLRVLGVMTDSIAATDSLETAGRKCFYALEAFAKRVSPTQKLNVAPTPDGFSALIEALNEGVKSFGVTQKLIENKIAEKMEEVRNVEKLLPGLGNRLKSHSSILGAKGLNDTADSLLEEARRTITPLKRAVESAKQHFEQIANETATKELLDEFDQETQAMLSAADPDGKLAREATLTADIAAAEALLASKNEALKDKREKVQLAVGGFVEAYAAWLEKHERAHKLTAEPTETERAMLERVNAWGDKIATILQKMGAPTRLKAADVRNWWQATKTDAKARNAALNNLWPGLFA